MSLPVFIWHNCEPTEEFGSELGVARLYLSSTGSQALIIEAHSDNITAQDFVGVDCSMEWEDVKHRLTVPADPDEGDYVIAPDLFVVPIGERFEDYESALARIAEHMESEQFWPDVWLQDDHGGFTNVSADLPSRQEREGG